MKCTKTLKIPEKNGEFFCSYALPDIPFLLKSNRKLFDSYDFKVAGNDYNSYRQKVERDILCLIANSDVEPFPRPFIVTGHQPVIHHPGAWVKNILADKLAKENNGSAFDLIIDYDSPHEIGCDFLVKKETVERKNIILMRLEDGQPIECCLAPDSNRFKEFCEKIKTGIQSFPNNDISKNVESFCGKGEKALQGSNSLAEFIIKTRKGYEKGSNFKYFDIMLSRICDAPSFLLFILHIAGDIEQFFAIYNQQLEEYRINHKLRYKANPFPDLKRDNEKLEIPFWHIKNNRRYPVYVTGEGEYIYFYADNYLLFKYIKGDFDMAIKIIEKNNIILRPKAVSLTLFARLFFSDLFIHGIGGAKYDKVTDGIIKKYFKVEPPSYIAASLTLFPDLPLNNIEREDIDYLKTIIRNVKFKPEIFEDKIEDSHLKSKFRELTEQKQELFKHKPSGKSNKEHFKQLKILTIQLSEFLSEYLNKVKGQLIILEGKEQDDRVIRNREYPYFFYDTKTIKEMIK